MLSTPKRSHNPISLLRSWCASLQVLLRWWCLGCMETPPATSSLPPPGTCASQVGGLVLLDCALHSAGASGRMCPLRRPAPRRRVLPVAAAAAVQNTLSFSLNGMVFFFAGASAVNFMVR